MGRERRSRVGLAVSLILLLIAAACGGDGEETPRDGGDGTQSATILLPFPFAVPFYSVFVAEANGYFEEEGLEVTVETADGSASVVQQVVAGNVDIGMSDPGPIIDAVAQGQELATVYVFSTKLIYGLVAPEESSVSSVADLAGETVGVSEATAGEVPFLEALLAANGVDPDQDVEVIETGAGGSTAAAFERDRVAAYMSDYFNIIELGFEVDLKELSLDEFELYHGASVIVPREMVEENPELIIRLSRALAKASEFTHASPEAALKVIGEAYPDQVTDPEGFDLLVIEEVINRTEQYDESDGQWGFNRPESWAGYVDFLSARGELLEDLDPTSLYTNEFIEDANDFDKEAIQQEAQLVASGG